MAASDWLIPTVTGVPAIITGIILWIKAKPEARKMNTDTAVALVNASSEFATDVLTQMKDIRDRLAQVESRERRRDRLLRTHHTWDIQLVSQARSQGLDVAEPPPLWIEDD